MITGDLIIILLTSACSLLNVVVLQEDMFTDVSQWASSEQ